MNILNSHRPVNGLAFVGVLCLLLLNFGLTPVATVHAAADVLRAPIDEAAAPCEPSITFTSVPPFGSTTEMYLHGRVDCVVPGDFKIVIYIYPGSWWVKPTFADLLTAINWDGTWTAKIRTGGIDELATQIAAFLLPNGVAPPLLGGSPALPQALFDSSAAYLIQDRYRTIEFSGYTWNVKSSEGLAGPGPNAFSAGVNDVWVDGSGNLHLTIKYRNGKWYCTEVFTQAPLGYGTYTFVTASPIDQLDQNAVLGLFTWDDHAPQYNYREIDIEISEWGNAVNDNSQYVVQPWNGPGNIHRFDTALDDIFSTHSFAWQSDRIFFSSHQGHAPSLGNEIQSWLYTGPDIPPAGNGNARINLWLYNGLPPSDGQNVEVVLEAFHFDAIPLVTSVARADPNPTSAASVKYTVTFSEAVTGVNVGDFSLDTTGLMGATITGVTPVSNAIYTVTVSTGSGSGTIGLDVIDDGTIKDATNNPLGGVGLGNGIFTTGETYTVWGFKDIGKWTPAFDQSHGWNNQDHVRTVGDVNGDGRADLVGFGLDGIYVSLSNGAAFGSISKWSSSFDQTHGWNNQDHVRTAADVSGDGKADLVGFGLDGVYVALSTGSSFGSVSKWTSSFDQLHGWNNNQHVRTAGDVNGDGKADLVGFGLDGVYVALSTGSSFGSVSKWTSSFDQLHAWNNQDHVRTVADVTGDGKADLAGFGLDGVYIALSTGTGFSSVSKWTSAFDQTHGWNNRDHVRTVGDVNGDGRADLIGFGLDGVYVALSTGGGFTPVSRWTPAFDYSHGWRVDLHVRTGGDVNNDDKTDLVGFGLDGVYIATSR